MIFGGDDVVPIRSAIMVSLLSRNDWSIGDKGEIDSWVGPNYFVDNLKKQETKLLTNLINVISSVGIFLRI